MQLLQNECSPNTSATSAKSATAVGRPGRRQSAEAEDVLESARGMQTPTAGDFSLRLVRIAQCMHYTALHQPLFRFFYYIFANFCFGGRVDADTSK